MSGSLILQDKEGNELYSLNYVVYPTVNQNGNIRELPSVQSNKIATTTLPNGNTPLLVIGATTPDFKNHWLQVWWLKPDGSGSEGWLHKKAAIDIQTGKSPESNKINEWMKSGVVREYLWPVPGEYQAEAFTLYSDSPGGSKEKIVALPEGGTVKVLRKDGKNSDPKRAEVDDKFVKVEVTFWVPKEWYQDGRWQQPPQQQPEEESTLTVCWSPGGPCKDDSGFNFGYFNQKGIMPNNSTSQNNWLPVTVQGWMKKERILSEQLQSQ